MFAAFASDSVDVYGCEMSQTMFEICCNVLVANNLSDRIRVIDRPSDDLSIPNDLPRRYGYHAISVAAFRNVRYFTRQL